MDVPIQGISIGENSSYEETEASLVEIIVTINE